MILMHICFAGVTSSDVFAVFLTRGVLSRPFCALGLRTALKLGKPILLLHGNDKHIMCAGLMRTEQYLHLRILTFFDRYEEDRPQYKDKPAQLAFAEKEDLIKETPEDLRFIFDDCPTVQVRLDPLLTLSLNCQSSS